MHTYEKKSTARRHQSCHRPSQRSAWSTASIKSSVVHATKIIAKLTPATSSKNRKFIQQTVSRRRVAKPILASSLVNCVNYTCFRIELSFQSVKVIKGEDCFDRLFAPIVDCRSLTDGEILEVAFYIVYGSVKDHFVQMSPPTSSVF